MISWRFVLPHFVSELLATLTTNNVGNKQSLGVQGNLYLAFPNFKKINSFETFKEETSIEYIFFD